MTEDQAARTCPWCSAAAPEPARQCPACGAALAQRESIGGLAIPGLTTIDPALQAIDGQPIHLRGPSPSQGMASGVMAGIASERLSTSRTWAGRARRRCSRSSGSNGRPPVRVPRIRSRIRGATSRPANASQALPSGRRNRPAQRVGPAERF